MVVLEFLIVGNINGFLWKPINPLARSFCEMMRRKNLTEVQIQTCKEFGFIIKANLEKAFE